MELWIQLNLHALKYIVRQINVSELNKLSKKVAVYQAEIFKNYRQRFSINVHVEGSIHKKLFDWQEYRNEITYKSTKLL